MASKLGSFRHSFTEKREKEKLISSNSDFSANGYEENDQEEEKATYKSCGYSWFSVISDKVEAFFNKLKYVGVKAWEMGRSDPRKIVFSAKMGVALVLISLLIFFKEPIEELSQYSVWAILTVVVVFEFSIGATLSKGFNRALGTLSAGGLALGMGDMCQLAGDWEEAVIILSIFVIGFLATYAKLYPTMKPYEYGFRVFILTYCFIMVSGYQTKTFLNTAVTRFILIALGAGVSLAVNIFIYPIWAGEDLHNLVSKNFMGVASSLEECVNGYLHCLEYERVPSKILAYEASDDPVYSGYRSVVQSTSQEDALMGFAIWEPPHGRYKMLRYPWKNYVKVAGSLRHCAFTVMSLHGCILSEIQAPAERRQVFCSELQRVGTAGAKVLRELGTKVKMMEKLGTSDILFEVHEAAEDLQRKVDRKSYLLVNSNCWEIKKPSRLKEASQDLPTTNNDDNNIYKYNSLSEALLDLQSWDATSETDIKTISPAHTPSDRIFAKQRSLPTRRSGKGHEAPEEKSDTYENASVLSLATFTSLLIEFVARLQNLVDAFEELSEKANFKEPVDL
ncbi:Aluminum-activated malate transporter 9 [Heracleum sosnowskyi]|uniref:Aluminum-activated malate transporter 9 n=1 Tax=Heracleum sosnowskyi TaxID=360622 RepID=A0AAD8MHF5_9APIA|nr:Aluminum-activated malate transporter 9 [Heracleum sosnowskyi]